MTPCPFSLLVSVPHRTLTLHKLTPSGYPPNPNPPFHFGQATPWFTVGFFTTCPWINHDLPLFSFGASQSLIIIHSHHPSWRSLRFAFVRRPPGSRSAATTTCLQLSEFLGLTPFFWCQSLIIIHSHHPSWRSLPFASAKRHPSRMLLLHARN